MTYDGRPIYFDDLEMYEAFIAANPELKEYAVWTW